MIVVSDSTPLIHLAKSGRLDILFSLYNKILITEEVYREVVEEGLILEKEDAVIINEHIGKKIQIKNPGSSSIQIMRKYYIHQGEAESILLALETNALLLMNERDGRIAAKSEGINVKGTIGVLFEALKKGVIDKQEALSVLSRFRGDPHSFWIEPDIIKGAMEKISWKE
jgi:predicted nucleic acid-binding protein